MYRGGKKTKIKKVGRYTYLPPLPSLIEPSTLLEPQKKKKKKLIRDLRCHITGIQIFILLFSDLMVLPLIMVETEVKVQIKIEEKCIFFLSHFI